MTLAFGSRSTEVTLGYVLAFVVESDRDAVAGRKRHVISEFERGIVFRQGRLRPPTLDRVSPWSFGSGSARPGQHAAHHDAGSSPTVRDP